MFLLSLFLQSMKIVHLQLAYFQASAGRPQADDRNWCSRAEEFSQRAPPEGHFLDFDLRPEPK
jgi:hypothetical protein